MASRALMVVLAVVVSVSVAGASAVYFQMGPGRAPGRSPAGGTNGTNGTNAISDRLTTDGNNKMTMSIPLVGTAFVSTDVKDHYTIPAGKKKVVVNISWDKTGWDLNLAIGTGDCPDNGAVKASQNNVQNGPVALEFKADGEALEDCQWFVHAACNDPGSHRGESVTFSYTVTTKCCG
jgi:hypothetical protein